MARMRLTEFILAGDVGGTKTNIGLFYEGKKRPKLHVLESYPTREAPGLEELLDRFLAQHPAQINSACFAVAGPVTGGVARMTNLPWLVSERNISKRLGWERVSLVNDLAATASALPFLGKSELHLINEGKPEPGGNLGLTAPGTGLGMALATVRDGKIHPMASEGGHVDFAPRNELEIELLRYLQGRMPRVSVERLGSGPGLATIYLWLKEYRRHTEPDWLTEQLRKGDPAAVISEAALLQKDAICLEALDIFVSIMGAVAGNLALTGTTLGGMYLGGGIPPKILPKLDEGGFMRAFTDKGRFQPMLSKIPVHVILNDKAALLGAACWGL